MGRKQSKRKPRINSNNNTSNSLSKSAKAPLELPPLDSKPITISDRLNLPPYQDTTTNNQEQEDDSIQLEFRPRAYFVTGLCYLCSSAGNSNFACPNCDGMVEYCSSIHLKEHTHSHSQLCPLLAELSRRYDVDNSSIGSLDPDDWRRFRLATVDAAKVRLGRDLELWEREALLYPRLCSKCRCSKGLKGCAGCGVEMRCERHLENWHGDIVGRCDEMRLFGAMLRQQWRKASCSAPEIPSGWRLKVGEEIPKSMDEAMRMVFGEKRYACIDATSYAALSVVASPPLTALKALVACHELKDLQKREELCVHVIGAEIQFECANLGAWEKLFMHLLPGLKKLRLELYGPELQVPAQIAQVLERPNLCSSCRACKRQFHVKFHCCKLYHQVEHERKPDLVCLFNPGLYRTTAFGDQDSWPPTIEKFCKLGSPILVTSYTEVELPLDLERARQIHELKIELEPQRNPFASLRPERNFVSDDVVPLIYKNYFFSVVRGISTHLAHH